MDMTAVCDDDGGVRALSTRAGNLDLIRRIHASWSQPDPEKFVELFTAQGEFEDVTYSIRLRGREQLYAHARRMQKHYVSLQVAIKTCDATDATGVAEWRLSHVYSGNFDGVDCSGKQIEVRGLSIYQFAEGRIARAADYWNYMEMIRAVGVLPRELRNLPPTYRDSSPI